MKCAPFCADSAKRMPWLARIADRIALDVREAADERLAVELLELVEAAAVDEARDQLARVDLVAEVLGDQAVEVGRVDGGRLGGEDVPRRLLAALEVPHDLPRDRERVLVGGGVVVGDAGEARVHVGAAQLLGGHVLAGRGLHERRAADEDRAGALHDHRLVAHRGHVGAAGGARAHHDGDLRDPGRRHARLVVEDPAEVLAVGEDLVLQRQVGAARVDEVDARQAVLRRDLLGAEVLLDREREVRAALHGRVVGDDHALAALDDADPGHDPRAGRLAVVQVPGGQRAELEEGAVRVAEEVDPLARGQLAAAAMPLRRSLAAAPRDERGPLAQLRDERLHPFPRHRPSVLP